MKSADAVLRIVIAAVLIGLAGSVVAQQVYPNKPIRLISPNPPGGSTSLVGRLIGQKLSESWGQNVFLDNRPGGNGFIGGQALATSPPDGYSIMIITATHINTPLLRRAPYDTIKDFAPVATLAEGRALLVIHPSLPANNLREFIALAKSKPGELNFSSSGAGSPLHLDAELFNIMAGIKTMHIPYKGGGPSLVDLVGGQVQFSFQTPIVAIPHVKSGRLKALAISGERRVPSLPQVPTFAEAGLPGYRQVGGWYGILAPAATPKEIIDKMSTEIARILAMSDTKERLDAQGMEPLISTPAQFAALLKTEIAQVTQIIKTANIKAD